MVRPRCGHAEESFAYFSAVGAVRIPELGQHPAAGVVDVLSESVYACRSYPHLFDCRRQTAEYGYGVADLHPFRPRACGRRHHCLPARKFGKRPSSTAPPLACPANNGTVTGTITPARVIAITNQNVAAMDVDALEDALTSNTAHTNIHTAPPIG